MKQVFFHLTMQPTLLTLVILLLQVGTAGAQQQLLQPARVSCNAAYSAPCARTNAKWLAVTSAQHFRDPDFLLQVNGGYHNMDTGFYSFVVDRATATCLAHGANPDLVGLSLRQIFDQAGIGFANADALHQRFMDAADRGGDWVQYMWSGDNGVHNVNDAEVSIHSKLAYVTNLTAGETYLGVGYENRQLPPDIPCQAQFDSWCSINNVRSLLGAGQFRLESAAVTLENFEAAAYDLSFDAERYTIPEGFYPFLYHYDGRLVAHAVLHQSFGLRLPVIFQQQELGTANDGLALHDKFVATAEAQQADGASGWIQYPWRNHLDEPTYTKIAYITKIVFDNEPYYLGVGYNFIMPDASVGPLNQECSDQYNLPCAFQTALQLSSHALSHAISYPFDNDVQELFDILTFNPYWRRGPFYIFAYTFDGICMAHGLVPEYVGMSLGAVFARNKIPLDANQLHEQFRGAAVRGGGWVSYDWLVPDVPDSDFEKISYIFRISIGGQDYYGGVGFNHELGPIQLDADYGRRKNKLPIPCSSKYGLDCSEVNARAILGKALADLTLATSPVSSGSPDFDQVLQAINEQQNAYRVNDFYVAVFSTDGMECPEQDGSGCCLAHGNDDSLVLRTWQQILDADGITAIRGTDLHEKLVAQSNTAGSSVEYPWTRGIGEAQAKKSWTSRFRDVNGRSYYVVAEYLQTPPPPACDACPKDMECTDSDQSFCEEKPDATLEEEPAFVPLIVIFSIGIPFLLCCFWIQKRRSVARIQAIEERLKKKTAELDGAMQGMVTVTCDMPIQSPEKYQKRVDNSERAALSSGADSTAIWFWEEDNSRLTRHQSSRVLVNTSYVQYHREISRQLEHAYQSYTEGKGLPTVTIDMSTKVSKVHNATTGANYEMNFKTLTQKNLSTNFERNIRREEVDLHVDSEVANSLPDLPEDVDFSDEAEDLLPTFKGQVIQVSKVHPSKKWLFGNVLYDPLLTEALQQPQTATASSDGLNTMLANALHDRPTSGWFPKSVTKPADLHVMRKLLDTLGGQGAEALKPPDTWEEAREGRVPLQKESSEYQEVAEYFLAHLGSQRDKMSVRGIERIQTKPLWQSYSVKKQTMKTRDKQHRVHNHDSVEKRWLFHGTTADAVPKIEKQGFNRAFAGRDAVRYGVGVYFARNASYSSHPRFSKPDHKGIQRMFLCRVAVGDWCKGTDGQITPDPKTHNKFELFDSTVDNVQNPKVFVVYHDAQAYPDYLVSFKRK